VPPPPPGYGPPPPGYGAPGPYGYAHPAAPGRPWAPKPGIIPLRPLTLGEILDGSFSAFRWNPKPILIPAVILAVVTGVLAAAISLVLGFVVLPQLRGSGSSTAEGVVFAGVSFAALGIVSFAGTSLLTGFVTGTIGQAVLGRKETIASAWRLFKPRAWATIGGMLLYGLFVGGGWLLAVALSAGIGFGLAAAHVTWLGVLLGVVIGLTASVFALMFWYRWMFVIPVVVLEHTGPLKALGRSWRLVRGSWWRVFGIMFLVSLIVSFVQLILRIPFQAGGAAVQLTGASLGSVIGSAIGLVIASAVTAPLKAGAVAVLYTDLRMRREGMDIALQASLAAGGQPLTNLPAPTGPRPGTQPPGGPEPGAW